MIIVTGANGFIGSGIVWQLNEAGHKEILCVDSVPLSERSELLKRKDYTRFLLADELWSVLEDPEVKEKLQWVIHMGACSVTTETNWDFLKQNNVEYSNRLIEWCTQNEKPIIYASSAATYGGGEKGFDDQAAPHQFTPLNLYGKSKLETDIWMLAQKEQPPHWYGLRFFNVFGPNEYHKEDMASVVYKASLQIKEQGSLKLFRSHHPDYEDGKQFRDFVYVRDITRWILELMDKTPKSGIYNMGYGEARTWLDLATAVFKNLEKEINIDWIDIPTSIRDQYQYYTEARMESWREQGLSKPQWPLEKAIEDYTQNFLLKDNPYL